MLFFHISISRYEIIACIEVDELGTNTPAEANSNLTIVSSCHTQLTDKSRLPTIFSPGPTVHYKQHDRVSLSYTPLQTSLFGYQINISG